MIKIKIYCVGNLKENYLKEMSAEYLKRLQKFAKISIFEFKEMNFLNNNLEDFLENEDKKILENLSKDDYVFLLDLHGKELDSIAFSNKVNEVIGVLRGDIAFVIGGTYGVSNSLRKRANFALKLSELTFTHQMTRVILLEQLYRSFKIINNEEYHH